MTTTNVFPPEITEEFIKWKELLEQEDLKECIEYFKKRQLQDEVDILCTPQAWVVYNKLKPLIHKAHSQRVITTVQPDERKLAHLICEGFGLITIHLRHRYKDDWKTVKENSFVIGKNINQYDDLVSNRIRSSKNKVRLDRLQRTTLPNKHNIRLHMGPPTDSHFLQLCQEFKIE